MVDAQIQRDLLEQLQRLPVDKQRQVLAFAHGLVSSKSTGSSGSDLLPFAGMLSPEDARQIAAAIESACEQVNADEWRIPT